MKDPTRKVGEEKRQRERESWKPMMEWERVKEGQRAYGTGEEKEEDNER